MKRNRGFTLVELIVVITIMGILAGFGFTNFTTSQKRARDGKRKADLEQIRSVLEMYRTDNGEYVSSGWNNIDGSDTLSSTLESGGYMSSVPVDPVNNVTNPGPCSNPSGYRYNYMSVNSAQGYVLTAIMEIADSHEDSPCTSLSNWGSVSWCSASPFDTEDYCYGVQNP